MSRRFGRGQKKWWREEVARVAAVRDRFAEMAAEADKRTAALAAELYVVTKAIEDIAPNSAALPIKTVDGAEGYGAPVFRESLGDGSSRIDRVLSKLRLKAVRDELQKGLVVRAEYRDGRCEFFMTQESLDYSRVREAMALELCRRVMHEFSRIAHATR